jgi:hypothetical protein
MAKLRALAVFGTRPEAIKMAPVVHECAAGVTTAARWAAREKAASTRRDATARRADA